MVNVARRFGIVVASFVIAWMAVSLAAAWLFGSGNVLVWVIAVLVAVGVYLILRPDRRVGQ